jgi:hypothetical protein
MATQAVLARGLDGGGGVSGSKEAVGNSHREQQLCHVPCPMPHAPSYLIFPSLSPVIQPPITCCCHPEQKRPSRRRRADDSGKRQAASGKRRRVDGALVELDDAMPWIKTGWSRLHPFNRFHASPRAAPLPSTRPLLLVYLCSCSCSCSRAHFAPVISTDARASAAMPLMPQRPSSN